ncbi:MAG: SH3 domain-containing protein [Desulfomonile tiedjei]|uniref:SH3 domain-containing protein n=1 Tax=Desulfomonile tiedjei TaxID=2358 RepID=A0A9D6Z4T6_9BACT|nr:SH3 domain-containing protein [Desulfomonile tiedjei]
MCCNQNSNHCSKFARLSLLLAGLCLVLCGCQEVETVKRELLKKVQGNILKKKNPFTPREGITLRPCSLFQTANPNSEVIIKLPAETPLHLMDKVGELYRVRVRDGREGYVEEKVVGGQDVIVRTNELRRSIEGMPVQGEGIIKTKANFRLEPGREPEIIEILPPGKKFEIYERVVTVKRPASSATRGRPGSHGQSLEDAAAVDEPSTDQVRKDVWYKVKLEDGRVGYIYTHNMKLSPPEDIARTVPFMRMVGWRTVNSTDDPDRGAKSNFIVAYAPIGKDAGCDYTRLYFMSWSTKLKRRVISWQLRLTGVLPITDYHSEGKPGFSVRYLHPGKKDKLVLASFVFAKGAIRKVGEEEIPNPAEIH